MGNAVEMAGVGRVRVRDNLRAVPGNRPGSVIHHHAQSRIQRRQGHGGPGRRVGPVREADRNGAAGAGIERLDRHGEHGILGGIGLHLFRQAVVRDFNHAQWKRIGPGPIRQRERRARVHRDLQVRNALEGERLIRGCVLRNQDRLGIVHARQMNHDARRRHLSGGQHVAERNAGIPAGRRDNG